jgi:hypothetical protein
MLTLFLVPARVNSSCGIGQSSISEAVTEILHHHVTPNVLPIAEQYYHHVSYGAHCEHDFTSVINICAAAMTSLHQELCAANYTSALCIHAEHCNLLTLRV